MLCRSVCHLQLPVVNIWKRLVLKNHLAHDYCVLTGQKYWDMRLWIKTIYPRWQKLMPFICSANIIYHHVDCWCQTLKEFLRSNSVTELYHCLQYFLLFFSNSHLTHNMITIKNIENKNTYMAWVSLLALGVVGSQQLPQLLCVLI